MASCHWDDTILLKLLMHCVVACRPVLGGKGLPLLAFSVVIEQLLGCIQAAHQHSLCLMQDTATLTWAQDGWMVNKDV
jgi:hypothetical protein